MAALSRIAPEVPVKNLQESLAFYEQKLGFQTVMQMPAGNYAIVERDGLAIHLFEDGSMSQSSAGMHLFTPDLDNLHAEISDRGAPISQQIEMKPWGTREFRVTDPSGNELKFTEAAGES